VTTSHVEQDQTKPTSAATNAARPASIAVADGIRRGYAPPRLRTLGCTADLLEILGPAQANYNGP
jgi:hypothetical protein